MDWSRAKSILILTFLGLNIFLGYRLWKETYLLFPSRVVSVKEIAEAEGALSRVGLVLKAPVSRQVFTMPFLTVSSRPQGEKGLVESLFDPVPGFIEVEGEEGFRLYQEGNRELRSWDKGRVLFSRQLAPLYPGEENKPDKVEIISRVEDFLQEHDLLFVDARLDEVYPLGNERWLVSYTQVYKNQLLFSGYLRVWVSPVGVEKFDLYWLYPQEFAGQEINTISAPAALLGLAEIVDPGEYREVEAITIGYYSQAYDAHQWDMVPAWCIKIAPRGIYYINAFTGDLEGKDDFSQDPGVDW